MSSIHYSIIKQCQDLDRLTIDTRHSLNLDIRRSWYNTPMVSGAGHLHSHVERGSKTDKGGWGPVRPHPGPGSMTSWVINWNRVKII